MIQLNKKYIWDKEGRDKVIYIFLDEELNDYLVKWKRVGDEGYIETYWRKESAEECLAKGEMRLDEPKEITQIGESYSI